MNNNTKKMTTLSMLCALSFIMVIISRALPPIVLFLQYDPKDIIIALGGFIYGPLAALIISATVSFVEFFTVSDTGIIGLIMNIISSCTFSCTAAIIYKNKRTISGAVWGLIFGTLLSTAAMLLWNYSITPLYMKIPRQEVAALLLPAFLPFNLIKGGLNTAFTLLIYKPVVSTLRKAKLINPSANSKTESNLHLSVAVFIVSIILIVCLFAIISLIR